MTEVGVAKAQAVPYSHEQHVSGLGLDCRYCHTAVEESNMASIPPTETCMGCHRQVAKDAPTLELVQHSPRPANRWNGFVSMTWRILSTSIMRSMLSRGSAVKLVTAELIKCRWWPKYKACRWIGVSIATAIRPNMCAPCEAVFTMGYIHRPTRPPLVPS